MSNLLLFGVVIATILILGFGALGMVKAFYRKVDQGTALIINGLGQVPKVTFTGGLIIPVIYRAEEMHISLITMDVDRRGHDGLICKDNMRADIRVAFYLRVNETAEDVLRVAKAVGAARASDKRAVEELFNAKFSEALKTVGKKFEFLELFENRDGFRQAVVEVIGKDLNGYVLEDVAIDYLEQTKKGDLDPNNIMDAEGIRKITQLTAAQNIQTNVFAQDEQLAITKKNTETQEAMLAMQRQQAEAQAKQKREIISIQAREDAEGQKVVEEQRLVKETARLSTEEQVQIRTQEQQRQVEVAEQNRLRAVAIEAERVARARQLEQVTTDREVQMQNVERDKVVEQGRTEVANVVRERTAIEQTVAAAEEKIKDVRVTSEAERERQARVIGAEAAAQEQLVQSVKQAEAQAQAAAFRATEITTIADAELAAASKTAEAKRTLAEGTKAEQAAPGLAAAQVQEAQAVALEKTGVAEATVTAAKAEANYKQGNAEARVLGERLEAEASGQSKMGLAKAEATRAMGEAEAASVGARMQAEAKGLTGKFEAMGTMSEAARSHEEFRMQLETGLQQTLAAIAAGEKVSTEQAKALAAAMANAKIEVVGGDAGVFEQMTKGISLGKTIESFVGASPLTQQVLALAASKLASSDSSDAAKA